MSLAMSSRQRTVKTGTPKLKSAAKKVVKGQGKQKVAKHVDQRVQARNTALNAFGGVKVDVFVRIRPQDQEREKDQDVSVTHDGEQQEITLMDVTGHPAVYSYDKVYGPESDQETVYADCVAPIVEQVCSGLSSTLFAYGQTGTGKTYTMRGDLSDDVRQHGVIQRSLVHLFTRLTEHDYTDIGVKCSFLEIYNEELEDLFVGHGSKSKKPAPVKERLTLVDHDTRGCVCKGLTEVKVDALDQATSIQKVMQLLNEAEAKCRYSETKMNKMSNRAHRIFTLIVSFKRYDTPVTSTLTFVDLAGSEDISKSGAKGMTAREAAHINKSLLTLGRVINALACNEKHIPYRDSKLTRLLSEALGGVCKTSFIACVSPCAGSTTESTSTLRYAERAMEALNISQIVNNSSCLQLPRWKQDEIIIDGLTRRVQQLVEDMDSMKRMHFEDMRDLKNERDDLRAETERQQRTIAKMERKIDRLLGRKSELKAGTALLASQKENLLAEKAALREELLLTRSQRDGYLTDRKAMNELASGVRNMRERLLSAHKATEGSLTTDANALKGVIEGAVDDIEELHTEVGRKKELSLHNEQTADEFRDRLSTKLRQVVQHVDEFKLEQDKRYSTLHGLVGNLKDSRQKEASSMTTDVGQFNAAVVAAFKDLNLKATDVLASRSTRIGRGRDDAKAHLQQLTTALEKTQDAVVRRLNELREHSQELDGSLNAWAAKIQEHLEETDVISKQYSTDLRNHLNTLSAHTLAASESQLSHLDTHADDLAHYLTTEKAALESTSTRLIDDINTYVKRMISDFASQATRRTDTAVTAFQNSTSSLTDQLKELQVHHTKEFAAVDGKVGTHREQMDTRTRDGKTVNGNQLQAGIKFLGNVTTSAGATEADVKSGVSTTTTTAQKQHEAKAKFFQEDQGAANNAAEAVDKAVAKAMTESNTTSDTMRKAVASYAKAFASGAKGLDDTMVDTHENVRSHVKTTDEDIFDAEADAVNYVMTEIVRDVKDPPTHKSYTYPVEYAVTNDYGEILDNVFEDYDREAGILEGRLTPGQGTDYPGELGPEDHSGLLTSTQPQPPTEPESMCLDRAVYESATEEYEDPSGFVDPMDRVDEDDDGDEDAESVLENGDAAENGAETNGHA